MSEDEPQPSYGQILTSTSVIGGATFVGVLIGAVRMKILSILLGPAGFALFSLYGAVTNLVATASTMGIQSSGVRQVAMAKGVGDRRKLARTVVTLRRGALLLGTLGGAVLLAFCVPISRLTFGDASHAGALALLSLMIPFLAVSFGQTALVQGMRRIRHLASIRMLGAFFGLLVTIPLVFFLRERGVAPAMLGAAVVLMLVSWHFARRIRAERISLSWREVYDESKGLIGLGLAVMTSNLMMLLANYFIRTSIVHELGLGAAGHYQAAFTLAGVYVGMILTALGADFYPRLTAAARDDTACNRLVNEQSHVTLLLVGPGIAATLALAPWVIRVFYSAEFLPAVDVLRWQILGLLGRIVSWPMVFVILAKGRGRLFAVTETAAHAIHVLLVVYATRTWGLAGTGMAFFGLYLYYAVATRLVVGRVSGFRWSAAYSRVLLLYTTGVVAAFAAPLVLGPAAALGVGSATAVVLAAYSVWSLYRLLGPDFFRRSLERARSLLPGSGGPG